MHLTPNDRFEIWGIANAVASEKETAAKIINTQ
jgi:hypothetical protein